MREKTCAYFLSEINRLHLCGDCILLENIDSNGVVRHALNIFHFTVKEYKKLILNETLFL